METERKYLDADFEKLKKLLLGLNAISKGPHFESNIIYDTPELKLYHEDRLLRLRLQEWRNKSHNLLTFKYPPAKNSDSCTCFSGKNVKAREELELEIGDGALMGAILAQLGYLPVAKYEKVRESWLLDYGSRFEIELDLLPFGQVVEIEGDPAGMDSLAQMLGLDKSKISLKTYHELNQEWRKANGLAKSADLLFKPDQRIRLRADLGLAN